MAEEPQGWLARLRSGLSKSADRVGGAISDVFTKRKLDQAALDELEEILIRGDLGVATAARLTTALAKGRFDKEVTDGEVREALADEIAALLAPVAKPLVVDGEPRPFVLLVCGVNGSGKTTTIGKRAVPSSPGPRGRTRRASPSTPCAMPATRATTSSSSTPPEDFRTRKT